MTQSATRERILSAAAKLFYSEGIRAVSVDAVARKAGVTKRTLYYHFRSKDDLIAAYLEARDQPNLTLFQDWFAQADGDTADKIRAIFSRLTESQRHPKWRGCGFLRTSAELINMPGHPALLASRVHKKRVETWLADVLAQDGLARRSAELARQIVLLLDGAFADGLLHRDASYMEAAGNAAHTLIRQAAVISGKPKGRQALARPRAIR